MSYNGMRRAKLLFTAAIAGLSVGLTPAAFAQEAVVDGEEDTAAPEEESGAPIVVTGTRIQRPEAATATPVVAITAENIVQSGVNNVTELLSQTPALFGSETNFDAAGSQARTGAAGVNLLNLRNLGSNRTLVLVNGRRHVAGVSGEAAVDTNTIPVSLIERVDVLTGGVSSVYGADGVSGVVNFIMKRDFEGLDIRAQNGISDFGDAESNFFSVTAGKNFADDRGNIALNYEFRKDGRVGFGDRPNGRYEADSLVRNPNDIPDDPNVPDYIFLNRIGYADSSPGGALVIDNSFSPRFNGDGRPYDPGLFLPQSGFLAQGGDNTPINNYQGDLQAGTEHHSFNALFSFELTPDVRLFAEGKYVRTENFSVAQPSFDFFTFISEDNPLIPDNVRAAGLGDFGGLLFNRDNFDFGTRNENFERDLYRGVIGIDGNISDRVKFEASYVYGRNDTTYISTNQRIEDRYFAALDVVDVGQFTTGTPNGVFDCRVNVDGGALADAGNGNYGEAPQTFTPGACVPLNIFGEGAASQAALDFVLTDTRNAYRLEQHVANAYIAGDFGNMFELPGGAVNFAFGGEYRKEGSDFRPDAISTQVTDFDPDSGVLADLALLAPERGSFDVWEVFGEINVPILADRPFFDLLEFTVAGRYSDYSTVGSTESWSINGQWAPIRDIRFRGSYSKSVRAPNITELFAPRSGTFAFIDDPCGPELINQGTEFRAANCRALIEGLGVDFDTFDPASDINSSASREGVFSGNRNLTEEDARTWTAGVILQPSFVRGLTVTADWYDIRLTDAVRTASLNETAQFCVDSATLDNVFCNSITRSTDTGFVSNYLLAPQNVAFIETAGADVTVNYAFTPGDGGLGRFNLRGTVGYLDKLLVLPANGGIVDNNQGENGAPEWIGTGDVTWSKGNFTLNYGLQYVGDQLRFERDVIAGDPDVAAPEFLTIGERFIHDIRAEISTDDERARFYLGVNNFTDELPIRGIASQSGVGWLGRYFYAGIRITTDQLGF
ncbi:MAG: TonB-dependent receptor [Erythrobacter sp.]|uniref:TonB-dependent receptor plug domain-containing protein n=1 Tax=Erythrobacter sp. TaxID=1042 RepID=UPI0025D54330|nr:TonB-dependent receptor [Erythrobacter sp.]MCM0001005.1 TonB-dependent receptor [Erythrobacter sp.]